MKGKVIVSRFWTNFFSGRRAVAVVVFPFIFLLDEHYRKDLCLLNHERIHIRQAIEILVIPFYIWYSIEFLIRFAQYKNIREAYLNISFEREAYRNEKNLNYLQKRPFWAFRSYI